MIHLTEKDFASFLLNGHCMCANLNLTVPLLIPKKLMDIKYYKKSIWLKHKLTNFTKKEYDSYNPFILFV